MGCHQEKTNWIRLAKLDDCGEATFGSYRSWLAKHPSALDSFDEMMGFAQGKNIAVFLDYDGTLSKIVADPDKAFLSEKMRKVVQNVALHFPTAIISGRRLEKVSGFVQLEEVYYAGSHGMDILTPSSGSSKYRGNNNIHHNTTINEKGTKFVHFCPAQQFLPTIQEIAKRLKEKTNDIKGSMIEDNKFCVSVHFRSVKNKDVSILKTMVEQTMEEYPNLRISEGKKVMEIRPDIEWDKGKAVEYLLHTPGFITKPTASSDVVPIYIGDDKTDEDAFKQAIECMGGGLSIVVSSTPKVTFASHSLRDPNQVEAFLRRLVKWKKALQLPPT
ncbi:hypothetical protein FNV43_RR18154 [Rhamnella rubrinervis]|uniref:Trehalose 6-phosphate phosphatase n=1 Tax=Rhamnella rubrinervis TaxID=2594499 RepID=A0A8K0E423_9ROSA|nr:hypothetical protein FNV43_RR18154 [Rhamnella rubrinervis]